MIRPENPSAEINLNLEAPERDAKKIASLKVKAEVTIPAGIKTFKFPSLAQKDVTVKQGDVSLTLEDTEIDEQVWKVNVTLVYPGEGPGVRELSAGALQQPALASAGRRLAVRAQRRLQQHRLRRRQARFRVSVRRRSRQAGRLPAHLRDAEQGHHDPARIRVQGCHLAVNVRWALDGTVRPGRTRRPPSRVRLELGSLQTVFLKLLGHAPPRQAAVAGTTRDVSLVLRQQADEVLSLDLADQVAGQIG